MNYKFKDIINSIESSLLNKNYFAALTTSLILIDTCSSIHFPNQKVNKRYKKWCDNFFINEFVETTKYLSSSNVWFLRNSMLHQSSSDPTTNQYYEEYGREKVKDIVPAIFPEDFEKKVFLVDTDEEYPTLFFDVNFFCETVINSIKKWEVQNLDVIDNTNLNIFSIAHSAIDSNNPDHVYFFRKNS